MLIWNKFCLATIFILRGRGLGKINNAFSLVRTLQVGGLNFGVPKIYDRDCSPLEIVDNSFSGLPA